MRIIQILGVTSNAEASDDTGVRNRPEKPGK